MLVEIGILVLLQVLNGVFTLSEAAVIAANKNRLRARAERGDRGAEKALALAQDPTRFLSTVQVFITLIGIIGGAFGGAALSEELALVFTNTPLAPYGEAIAFALIVLLTTYLSLVIGELVPKRFALRNPERFAASVAPLMTTLSRVMSPIITVLSASTNGALWLLNAKDDPTDSVSEEDVRAVVQQAVEGGVIEAASAERVQSVLRLQGRGIRTLMTPRTDVVCLRLEDPDEANREVLLRHNFSRFPVTNGGIDHVVGVVETKDLLTRMLSDGELNIRGAMRAPLFVPATVPASQVVELFRETSLHAAFIMDEYGGLEGLVTVQDLLDEIVGEAEDTEAVQRPDGSWLLEGLMPIDEFKTLLEVDALPGERELFDTLAGFFMHRLGEVPKAGDQIEWNAITFEAVDMDGMRLDKLLVTRKAAGQLAGQSADQPGEQTAGQLAEKPLGNSTTETRLVASDQPARDALAAETVPETSLVAPAGG